MSQTPPELGLLSFDQACVLVVDFLKSAMPMGFWSVSRHLGDRQVYLHVRDDVYGKQEGGSHAWSDSFCQYVITGQAPQIAPRAMEVPLFAVAGVAGVLPIGAYVGIPIRGGDGEAFGTICGLDPTPRQDDLSTHAPLLHLLAALLGQILEADRLREETIEREARLRWRAFHDPLTGLANRDLFRDRLQHACDLQRRDLRTLGVLVLDLDGFKTINDQHGHASGDAVLIEVGARLRRNLRASDTAARLGGDEFAVLIEDGGQSETVARKIIDSLREPIVLDGLTLSVGVSVGVREVPPFAVPAGVEAILADADAAMYAAKRVGSCRLEMHQSFSPAVPTPDDRPSATVAHQPSQTRRR